MARAVSRSRAERWRMRLFATRGVLALRKGLNATPDAKFPAGWNLSKPVTIL